MTHLSRILGSPLSRSLPNHSRHTTLCLLRTSVVFDTRHKHRVARQWGKVMAQLYGYNPPEEIICAVKAVSYLCSLHWLLAKVVTGTQLGPLEWGIATPRHTPTSTPPSVLGFISCPQRRSNLKPAAPWFAKLPTALKAVFLQQVYVHSCLGLAGGEIEHYLPNASTY